MTCKSVIRQQSMPDGYHVPVSVSVPKFGFSLGFGFGQDVGLGRFRSSSFNAPARMCATKGLQPFITKLLAFWGLSDHNFCPISAVSRSFFRGRRLAEVDMVGRVVPR